MRDAVKVLIHYMTQHYDFETPILEIGSKAPSGQAGYSDMRPYLKGKEYKGVDIENGIGVDEIMDAHHLKIENESVGTILCLETVEHLSDPVRAVNEMLRCISPTGLVVITTHHWAPLHQEPHDYWRPTIIGLRQALLGGFAHKEIFFQGDRSFPHLLAAVASKADIKVEFHLNELNDLLPFSYPFRFQKEEK